MKGLWNFVQYNNAVPIAFFVVFGITSATFAASPQVRDATAAAVLSQQEQVLAGDNTYLLSLDVPAFDFALQVTNVTEDETAYYIDYQYNTVDPLDYVWRLHTASTSITVAKTEVQGKDLGLFISKQLGEVVAAKRAYLLAAQARERSAGESQKTVSITYSGLIGRFLNPEQKTFEGYTPVIDPVLPQESAAAGGCTANCEDAPGAGAVRTSAGGNRASSALISLQVMGHNPALVPVGAYYVDLGAVLIDEKNSGVSYDTYLNGKQTYSPQIDTTHVGSYTVEYRAKDTAGTELSLTKVVKVLSVADYEAALKTQVEAPPPPPEPEPTPAPTSPDAADAPVGPPTPSDVGAEPAPPPPPEATGGQSAPAPEPVPAPVEATSTPPAATAAPPVEATSTPAAASSTEPVAP